MKKTVILAAALTLLAWSSVAETVGEKTGANATLGIAPTTKDFVWSCWGPTLHIPGVPPCLNFIPFLVLLGCRLRRMLRHEAPCAFLQRAERFADRELSIKDAVASGLPLWRSFDAREVLHELPGNATRTGERWVKKTLRYKRSRMRSRTRATNCSRSWTT
jgi:hypothetical protein